MHFVAIPATNAQLWVNTLGLPRDDRSEKLRQTDRFQK